MINGIMPYIYGTRKIVYEIAMYNRNKFPIISSTCETIIKHKSLAKQFKRYHFTPS